ncbi:MAG: acyltransferase [Saccharofermentans sp.]|nr:acyltransferase [Saccharofermentans sp.]
MTDNSSYKIQLLRGLAIMAVVAIHNTPSGLAQICISPFINFAVGMFLFLSGMLSCASRWNPGKRIKKVLIPYLIWTMVYVIMEDIKTPLLIPADYIKMALTGKASIVMYYVFVYCELTLLIPLIDKLARSRFRYLGFVISPLEIVVMRLIPLITGIEVNKYISLLMSISCLGWFTYFYLGYLAGNKLIDVKLFTSKLVIIWALGITWQFAEGFGYYSMGSSYCGTQLKLSAVFTGSFLALIACRFIRSARKADIKWLHLLGDCSFGIYFSHIAIQEVLGKIPYYNKLILFPLTAILVTVCALGFVVAGRKILQKYAKYLALQKGVSTH